MRRADRLFQIVQYLRGGRLTTAAKLAERLEVSERTIYRDVRDLVGSGVPIEGEAGVGYRLAKSFVKGFDSAKVDADQRKPFKDQLAWFDDTQSSRSQSADTWIVHARATIELACGNGVYRNFARAEASQGAVIEALAAKGVVTRSFAPSLLTILEDASNAVLEEEADADAEFARVLAHQRAFRERYARWRDLAYPATHGGANDGG